MINWLKYSFILFLFWSCNNKLVKQYNSLSPEYKIIADSILMKALDREGLYTVSGNIKPISSIDLFQYVNSTTTKQTVLFSEIEKVQFVANKLSTHKFSFILNPFSRKDSNVVNLELYVVNNQLLMNTINEHQEFYHLLGINKYVVPETVLAITEYESKYKRWRSYGYLFGYPDHAVDFFVNAGKIQDSSSVFVKRNFFQIPVFKYPSGYFTYALPLDYKPNAIDSSIYFKSINILNKYKYIRNKYFHKYRTPVKLFNKMINQ